MPDSNDKNLTNWLKVCRQIKEDPDISHIKILAITDYDTKENRDRIMEAGAGGFE